MNRIASRPDSMSLEEFIACHHARFYFRRACRPIVIARDWRAAWPLLPHEYTRAPDHPSVSDGFMGSGLAFAKPRREILKRIWEFAKRWYPIILDGKKYVGDWEWEIPGAQARYNAIMNGNRKRGLHDLS